MDLFGGGMASSRISPLSFRLVPKPDDYFTGPFGTHHARTLPALFKCMCLGPIKVVIKDSIDEEYAQGRLLVLLSVRDPRPH